jgi:hypothetical protein
VVGTENMPAACAYDILGEDGDSDGAWTGRFWGRGYRLIIRSNIPEGCESGLFRFVMWRSAHCGVLKVIEVIEYRNRGNWYKVKYRIHVYIPQYSSVCTSCALFRQCPTLIPWCLSHLAFTSRKVSPKPNNELVNSCLDLLLAKREICFLP